MLKAAGFHEDAESFFMLEANLLRLRRVHGELRKQLQQALHLMSWEVMAFRTGGELHRLSERLLDGLKLSAQS